MSKKDGLRRKPKQARSIATINHILDTAAQLYAEHGYESVTTNHIAQAAKVSVGGLYRFFPNKDAIIMALTDRYIEGLEAVLPTDLNKAPMEQVVRQMIVNVVQFQQDHLMFYGLITAPQVGQLTSAMTRMHLTLEAWVKDMLTHYYPEFDEETIHLWAAAGMGMVKGMITMMQPPDSIPYPQAIEEIIAALMAYNRDFIQRIKKKGYTGS